MVLVAHVENELGLLTVDPATMKPYDVRMVLNVATEQLFIRPVNANTRPSLLGGEPLSGLDVWVPMPMLTAAAANELLDRARPLAERIIAGREFKDTGLAGGVVDFTADARAAGQELATLCDPGKDWDSRQIVFFFTADEWLAYAPALGVRVKLSDDTVNVQIPQMVREEHEYAQARLGAGAVVIDGLDLLLLEEREALRALRAIQLGQVAEQIQVLQVQQATLYRRLFAQGMTHRAIAQRAGVTHPTVSVRVPATRELVDEVAARVGAASAVWSATPTFLVLDDGRTPLLHVAPGGGEVFADLPGQDKVLTGVFVHQPKSADLAQ